ncbi:hypothetical protein IJG89_00175 [Candidatus Saccharibacteria bacterium]|nr:hypothetical protein [Candidatus Saccharibacteria bacterium]
MNNEQKVRVDPIKIAAVIIQVLFIIVAIVSIRQILEPKRIMLEVDVAGLNQEVPGLPDFGRDEIEFYVYRAVSHNNPTNQVIKNGFSIREGSLISKYYEDANINYVNFIVDIPSIEQSYRAAYVWSDKKNNEYISPNVNVAVTCLNEDEMIYDDFGCKNDSMYSAQTVVALIMRAINYRLEDNSLVMEPEYYGEDRDLRVKLYYSECDTTCFCRKVEEDGKNQALASFDDFMVGLGYSLEDVAFYFYNCEDEARVINEYGELVNQ